MLTKQQPKKLTKLTLEKLMEIRMTLEELVVEKRELGAQIQKLIQEFEDKYKCYAEIRQNSHSVMYSQAPRTFGVEVEAHL